MTTQVIFKAERLKTYQRKRHEVRPHFWRTRDGSEIDFVEESQDGLAAFECKWSGGSIRTRAWHNAFPSTSVTLVTRETIESLIV